MSEASIVDKIMLISRNAGSSRHFIQLEAVRKWLQSIQTGCCGRAAGWCCHCAETTLPQAGLPCATRGKSEARPSNIKKLIKLMLLASKRATFSNGTKQTVFYLHNDQLSLQCLPIWELLSKAQIDDVIRRSTSVLFKVHEIWNKGGGLRHMHDASR